MCYCSGGDLTLVLLLGGYNLINKKTQKKTNDFYFFPALGANASSGGAISGRFLTPFPALNHPTRAVERALLSAYAYRVLTVACNLMLCHLQDSGVRWNHFPGIERICTKCGLQQTLGIRLPVPPSPRLPLPILPCASHSARYPPSLRASPLCGP